MTETMKYYEEGASHFFASTVSVDMTSLYTPFLARVPAGGRILDAGCGSGRDAKAFAELGYQVDAFDASPALAKLASDHCGFPVRVHSFAEVDQEEEYDGIWACASLLHVPVLQIPEALERLWAALKPGGTFYCSFKLGVGERVQEGRSFTDADEPTLRGWLSPLGRAELTLVWTTADNRPGRTEQWLNAIVTKAAGAANRLVVGGPDPFLPHLSKAMSDATEIGLAVSFVKTLGLRLLLEDLDATLTSRGGELPAARVRLLTSDYLGITDPDALRLLLLLQQRGADVRVFVTQNESFHLKAYLFGSRSDDGAFQGTAFIGSSNISRQALQSGLEWNYRVTFPPDEGFHEAWRRFEELFRDPRTTPLTDAWIEAYERRRVPPPRAVAPGSDEQEPPPEPTVVQADALEALTSSREEGFQRGLVVLATGLGKTWLAAFDVARVGARRVLFVAHREEILQQAAQTFVRIRPGLRVGYYTGNRRDMDVDVLCASIQTLARAAHLERFRPQHFDYIAVDEFHHAEARTYRRLLAHFAPGFLLGLTATPDRTDQADILSLCDDNLVFTCDLFEGIESKLLAPFHYYGIYDEEVDYREIPWRNGKFDPEQLSSKLATLARARHALREWQERSQKRTLAFCVSIRHAEFMAAQFRRAGVEAAAVYAGSPMGRAEALSRLAAGQLRVIFSVDLFNEGVDLPSIDTVMMLRPTESKILFLQQFGRGLRRSEGKSHLVVLDFIGNHHSFLQKPPALFRVGSTYKELANFARAAERGELELPEGCFVNYDLRIVDLLKSLDSAGPAKEYEALKSNLGRRPTLVEFYRSGASIPVMRRQFGNWFAFVESHGDLAPSVARAATRYAALLKEVETTSMTKCFKMILLEAFLELNGFVQPPALGALAERSWTVLHRRRGLLGDLDVSVRPLADGSDPQWQRYWYANPVRAWTGGNLAEPSKAPFKVEEDKFASVMKLDDPDTDDIADLLQELVDYRLAAYEARSGAQETASNVIAFPCRQRTDLPYFPNLKIACGHFRKGRTDSDEHVSLPRSYGNLDPQRHFIARASGNSMNGGKHPIMDGDYLLLEHVTPTKAGSITGNVMAVERQDDAGDYQYLLRVVTKNAHGQYVLKANNPAYEDLLATDQMRPLARLSAIIDSLELQVGRTFKREDIPALFGEEFNPGSWQSGHVVVPSRKAHVLLVTLSKQGRAEEHRYHDYWIDDSTFHWESQNKTGPDTKRGREIIEHEALGISIHLFVRDTKLTKLGERRAAAFTYFGKVRYVSHDRSHPMGVTFAAM